MAAASVLSFDIGSRFLVCRPIASDAFAAAIAIGGIEGTSDVDIEVGGGVTVDDGVGVGVGVSVGCGSTG